jgi:hypothetical protein
MNRILTAAGLAFAIHASVAVADTSAVTEQDVRAMLARIPSERALLGRNPEDAQPAGFERWASEDVVRAIVRNAPNRLEAARLTVFAAYESGARARDRRGLCIAGDGGKSFGPWQENIAHAGMGTACDADRAARWWLSLERQAAVMCPDEPLAPIVGGCHVPKARRQAHARGALAARLATQ